MTTKAKLLATGSAAASIYDTATTSTGYFSLPAAVTATGSPTYTIAGGYRTYTFTTAGSLTF
jgi:hypothetical protein